MASLAEQYSKLTTAQKKVVDAARKSSGASWDADIGGVEGLASKGGGVSSTGSYIKPSSSTKTSYTAVTPEFDFMEQYKALQEAKTRAQIAALDKSRSAQLSALSSEKSTIAPKYTEARRGAITEAERGRSGYEQFLAQRGLQGSGAGAQSELAQNVAQQQALGGLRQQEVADLADIERRKTSVESAYASDVAAAEAGAEAEALQNFINQENLNRQFALQEAGLTGTLNGQQTLAGIAAEQSGQLFELQKSQIAQSLEAGEINIEQARFALEEAQDPNSIANQSAKIALEISKIQLESLPEQTRLAIETAQKQLAQIGKQPVFSALDKAKNELALIQINNEIAKLTGNAAPDLSGNIDMVQSGINSVVNRLQGEFNPLTGKTEVSPGLEESTIALEIVRSIADGTIGEVEGSQIAKTNGISAEAMQKAVNAFNMLQSGQLPGF